MQKMTKDIGSLKSFCLYAQSMGVDVGLSVFEYINMGVYKKHTHICDKCKLLYDLCVCTVG